MHYSSCTLFEILGYHWMPGDELYHPPNPRLRYFEIAIIAMVNKWEYRLNENEVLSEDLQSSNICRPQQIFIYMPIDAC